MSTANKLTYLNVTKQKLKQAINNIGGEVTDETTFRNYVAELENAYDRLPKTEFEEGESVTLENTLKGKLNFAKMYQEVEYIESTGTQYIDTGVLPNSSQKIEMKLAWLNSDNVVAFGARTSGAYNTSTDQLYFNYNLNLSSKAIFIEGPYLGDPRDEIGDDIVIGTPQIYVLNANKYQLSTTSQNYYLFGFNNQGVAIGNTQMKLYYCKIYNGETLVRDFIPCYRKSDNVIGLYDKVNGVFYTNAGTGTFTKGADVGNGFVDIVGMGQSKQETTQGYNLYNPNVDGVVTSWCSASLVRDIITLKAVHDGEIFLGNAYPAGNSYPTTAGLKIPVKPSTTYRVSVSNQEMARVFITQFNESNVSLGFSQANMTFTTQATTKYVTIRFGVYTAVNNQTYSTRLWLYEGSTEKPYEKYTGGQASPNPYYKQDIKGVAGWNRFYEKENGYISNLDGSISAQSGVSASDYIEIPSDESILYFYGKNLSVSSSLQYANRIAYYDSSKNWISGENKGNIATPTTYSIPNNAKYVRASIVTASEDLMIAFGGVKKYLPFNTIEEVVRGKNELEGIELGDIDPQGGVPFSSDSSFRSINYIPYDTSKTYYVSVNSVQPTNQGLNLRFYNASKQYIGYSTLTGSGSNFVITKGNQVTTTDLVPKYFRFRQTATAGPINSINDNVMIATISGATYEPYVTPKTYQFSLGDHKFYGIGDYKDELVYNVNQDKVYKVNRIAKHVLTENDGWVYDGTTYNRIYNQSANFLNPPCKIPSSNDDPPNILCDYLMNYNATTFLADNSLNGITLSQNGTISIRNTGLTSLEQYNAWLSTDKPKLYYVIRTQSQTLTEITNTTLVNQVKAWYYAQSNNETTIIEGNGDLPMIIKCRALKGE